MDREAIIRYLQGRLIKEANMQNDLLEDDTMEYSRLLCEERIDLLQEILVDIISSSKGI